MIRLLSGRSWENKRIRRNYSAYISLDCHPIRDAAPFLPILVAVILPDHCIGRLGCFLLWDIPIL